MIYLSIKNTVTSIYPHIIKIWVHIYLFVYIIRNVCIINQSLGWFGLLYERISCYCMLIAVKRTFEDHIGLNNVVQFNLTKLQLLLWILFSWLEVLSLQINSMHCTYLNFENTKPSWIKKSQNAADFEFFRENCIMFKNKLHLRLLSLKPKLSIQQKPIKSFANQSKKNKPHKKIYKTCSSSLQRYQTQQFF